MEGEIRYLFGPCEKEYFQNYPAEFKRIDMTLRDLPIITIPEIPARPTFVCFGNCTIYLANPGAYWYRIDESSMSTFAKTRRDLKIERYQDSPAFMGLTFTDSYGDTGRQMHIKLQRTWKENVAPYSVFNFAEQYLFNKKFDGRGEHASLPAYLDELAVCGFSPDGRRYTQLDKEYQQRRALLLNEA